jgi:hypothetical protein
MKQKIIRTRRVLKLSGDKLAAEQQPCGRPFDPSMRLVLTDEFLGRRHVVLVGSERRTFPQAPFEMLMELVWARLTTSGGYLQQDDCDTTRPNPDYFAKLADRVRTCLGDDSYLTTAPKRYRLPFLAENIQVLPGVLEFTDLNPEVTRKVSQVIDETVSDF